MRKLLSEFKKVAVFDYGVIEVLLFGVENGVKFSNTYGGIDELSKLLMNLLTWKHLN
jgi:hypothetical protein